MDFLDFFSWYLQRKAVFLFTRFEGAKKLLVRLLLLRRGAYQQPFLHLSMFSLITGAVLIAPLLSDRYPTLGSAPPEIESPSAVLKTLSFEEVSTQTEISEKPRDKVVFYKVKKGDTLSKISRDFAVSVDSLKWLNKLTDIHELSIGQEIKIPPVTGIVHGVQKGDTVYSLAKKYQTDPQKIVNWPFNEFSDEETLALAIGADLIIPDGIPPAVPKPVLPLPSVSSLASGIFLWPVGGEITQYPVWYHNALDIANSSAPGIASADEGVVSLTSCLKWGYGCHIILSHANNLSTLYGHLSSIYVSEGQKVGRGQIIGKMGSTGRSTGTHLHFEVRKNGVIVNPLPYFK